MRQPNILFLMVDQMQGQLLDPDHPCQTPQLDRLAARGVRCERAYTPNPVCSPARASLMTGQLPHNHGVLWVTHTVDHDQGRLRVDRPHWAQRLQEHGYRTAYFGKWHVEHSERPADFGWEVDGSTSSDRYRGYAQRHRTDDDPPSRYRHARYHDAVPGYHNPLHYAVTEQSPRERPMGLVTGLASEWLDDQARPGGDPWCCFISLTEPHDPFVAGHAAYARYGVDDLELPANAKDDLSGRPGLYRKAARQWDTMTDRERREAMACYYASVTEIDTLFGEVLERLNRRGELDNTIVVFTSDHGELLGAHGMYCKNVMAAEEIYRIPMVLAGPGIAEGATTMARIGLHQLGPTLLELVNVAGLPATDAPSAAGPVREPGKVHEDFQRGYAEYHGGRYLLTQRVLWHSDWKLVYNGFAEDELYDLSADPHELTNLAEDPAHAARLDAMLATLWQVMRDTGDESVVATHYPPLRLAARGPLPVSTMAS